MEHHDGVVLGSEEIFLHAIEIETLGSRRVVSVGLLLEASEASNSVVDWPCGGWGQEIDIFVLIPVLEEGVSNSERASA